MYTHLSDALPAGLSGPDVSITPVSAGLSGAGVYRVTRGGDAFVLKVSAPDEAVASWLARVQTQQRAADAGLAPRVLHVDESRRAVLSEFVHGGSAMPYVRNPATRGEAIAQLGDMVRRVHQLPIPGDARFREPRVYVDELWGTVSSRATLPAFAAEIVARLLAGDPPPPGPVVLSHNDCNPSNLLLHGHRLCLLDWDVASANEAFYDLATLSFFFRMDDTSTAALIDACNLGSHAHGPDRLRYDRRIVGALSGAGAIAAALRLGHPGAHGAESYESTPTIDEVYSRLQAGSLHLSTPDGQWTFGLALIKSSVA